MANIYKDEEAFLNSNPKPKATYYKGIINIKKGKNGTPYQMRDAFGKEQRVHTPNPTRFYRRTLIRIIGPIKYKIHILFFYSQIKHHQEKGHLDLWPTI